MELYTFLTQISTKEELSELIALVEEGSLEELFIAKTEEEGVAGEEWGKDLALVFSFSTEKKLKERLEKVSPTLFLDDLDEIFFEEKDGEFTLKGVFYPESELQEEEIIKQLH